MNETIYDGYNFALRKSYEDFAKIVKSLFETKDELDFTKIDFREWGGLLEVLEELDNENMENETIAMLKEKLAEIEKTETISQLHSLLDFFDPKVNNYLAYLNSPVLDGLYMWHTTGDINNVTAMIMLKERGEFIELQYFLQTGKIHAARIFIENGVKIQHINQAMGIACEEGYLEIVKLLLENGANIHRKHDIALEKACLRKHIHIAEFLLQNGANVHARNESLLIRLSDYGFIEIIELLLTYGANVHARNDQALYMACSSGHVDVVKLLLENGAHVNTGSLRWAIYNENIEILQLLLDYGADINSLANPHRIIRDISNNIDEIVKMLRDAGAVIDDENSESESSESDF